jgi:hypothetical protein
MGQVLHQSDRSLCSRQILAMVRSPSMADSSQSCRASFRFRPPSVIVARHGIVELSQPMTVSVYSNGTKVRDTIPVSLGSEFPT